MATRPVVSYDDITLPYDPPEVSTSFGKPPASKKRKRNQKSKQVALIQAAEIEEGDEGDYDEESRELTHEEIWDDSALVDAWDAAQQEYEMYHGNKDWKNEPVKKSPLWYNVPVAQNTNGTIHKPSNAKAGSLNPEGVEPDSMPLNFDTFVPMHDPSLPVPTPTSHQTTNIEGHLVSQDEAFSRAMNAMYWGGYWTAMYHSQRYLSVHGTVADNGEYPADESDMDDQNEFVPTQR